MDNNPKARDQLLKNWENKARGVYVESLKLMREGFHGLEVMAGKTMEITRIKLANQKALHHIRMLFTELGQRAFDALRQADKGVIRITPDISAFADQIRKLQSSIEENLNRLKNVTTVGDKKRAKTVPSKPARKPAAKKRSRRHD